MPVVVQRQVPTLLIMQKFVEMTLLQALDKAVDMPVVVPRQVPTVLTVQKPVVIPLFSSPSRSWTSLLLSWLKLWR